MNTGGPQVRLIDGRFELLRRLGGGGMGLVWLARDTALEREVAIKEVRPLDPAAAAADPQAARETRERVLREARALARLQHPNVVTVYHIVDTAEHPHPWIVMELVTGGSLHDRLTQGPLTVPEAARIGRGVLSALRAAHGAGIQHRDVKPGNVLLRTDGTPVLTDFGIAAMHGATALTATGALIGSPEYIAPERVRGEEGNASSDLWSLGMMLYVAIEGHHPLRRGTALATLAAVLDEQLPPPQHAGPLGPLLSALLAKDPAQRPDAEQLERALAAAELPGAAYVPTVQSMPLPPPAPGATGPADPPRSRAFTEPALRRRRTLMGVVYLCALFTVGSVLWLQHRAASTADSGTAAPPAVSITPGGDSATPDQPGSGAAADLLTPAGIRAVIKGMALSGKVIDLTVYPDHASAQVPTAADPTVYDQSMYSNGAAISTAGGPVAPNAVPVDLQDYDWDALPALLQKAQATLNVPNPTTRYVTITYDVFDHSPAIRVYLADDHDGGYLAADPKGKVLETVPRT
ncbi:serine/threonine-protein kinase [Kitasatospora viridis]|nr:serine/threonine-protein kinase [Kitasatospora viridis]